MALTELLLIRHGESAGNVAREEAESGGAEVIDIEWRDADTPLSEHGRDQARALGGWLSERPGTIRAVWSSPYTRASDTVSIALDAAELNQRVQVDERLRDRELGVLDRLTSIGIRQRFAAESQRRRTLGKLYYRPPGGESWADVALRLRSFLHDLEAESAITGAVLICAHDAVILLFRYILERMDESTLLELAATSSVANASVTRLVRPSLDSAWQTADFGAVDHLRRFGVALTHHGAEDDVHPR
ncbi:MAG TPA: histidine phosphatase family protein [Jatrophihabitantaceae bacterium]|jgi:broad specificity phosphatase PhoE|nr:histidine phosphatase family protein [Jatrophihabitantaceae bacterium]